MKKSKMTTYKLMVDSGRSPTINTPVDSTIQQHLQEYIYVNASSIKQDIKRKTNRKGNVSEEANISM